MGQPADDVAAIVGGDATCEQLKPFVKAAEALLSQQMVQSCMSGLTPKAQREGLVWLAAHLYSISPLGQESGATTKKSEKFENYSVSYIAGTYSHDGLLSTPYGSSANAILGGCLAQVGKAPLQIAFFG